MRKLVPLFLSLSFSRPLFSFFLSVLCIASFPLPLARHPFSTFSVHLPLVSLPLFAFFSTLFLDPPPHRCLFFVSSGRFFLSSSFSFFLTLSSLPHRPSSISPSYRDSLSPSLVAKSLSLSFSSIFYLSLFSPPRRFTSPFLQLGSSSRPFPSLVPNTACFSRSSSDNFALSCRDQPTRAASSPAADSKDRHNSVLRNALRESLQGRQLHQRR